MDDDKNRPAETLRDGNIKASIWENTREDKVTRSVQFRRSYRDQDGQYRDTDSFFGPDLLRLARLAEQSYDRLNRLREDTREQVEPKPARSRARDREPER